MLPLMLFVAACLVQLLMAAVAARAAGLKPEMVECHQCLQFAALGVLAACGTTASKREHCATRATHSSGSS
jgi:hypothetical protein